jgi:ribosomal protein S18 acetylase RimI-like enzyme
MALSAIEIVKIGPLKASVAYRVIEQSWLKHYRTFMPIGALLPFAGARLLRHGQRLLQSPGNCGYLAIDGTVPIGAMTLKRLPRFVEVDDLFVLPGYTSRGIGRALLIRALEVARKRGVRLRLEAMRNNRRARAFYERCGGKLVGFGHYGWGRGKYPCVFYEWPRGN